MDNEQTENDYAINFTDVGILVATRLRELRQSCHYSHDRLIKLLYDIYGIEVSRNSLMNYEQSDPEQPKFGSCLKMNATTLLCLADLYGVPVDYLLGRTSLSTDKEEIRVVMEYTGLSQQSAEKIISNPDIPYDRIISSEEFVPLYNKIRSFIYGMDRIKETASSAIGTPKEKEFIEYEKRYADGLIFVTLEDIVGILRKISGYNDLFSAEALEKLEESRQD